MYLERQSIKKLLFYSSDQPCTSAQASARGGRKRNVVETEGRSAASAHTTAGGKHPKKSLVVEEERVAGGERVTRSNYRCRLCAEQFSNLQRLSAHHRSQHRLNIPSLDRVVDGCVCREMYESALRGAARTVRFRVSDDQSGEILPEDFISQARHLMERSLEELGGVECRVHLVLNVRMKQVDPSTGETVRTENSVFSSRPFIISDREAFLTALARLLSLLESYTEKGSNWIVVGIDSVDFRLISYRSVPQFRGRSMQRPQYKLHPYIQNKKAVLNLQYHDTQYTQGECFKWALIAAIHHTEVGRMSALRHSAYKQFESKYNFTGITFPFTVAQAKQFERQNPNIYINIIQWDQKTDEHSFRVIHHAGRSSDPNNLGKVVNILAIDECLGQEPHYLPITDINRLFYTREERTSTTFCCERCLQSFWTPALLERHRNACYQGKPETIVPPEHATHSFRNHANRQKLPYVLYADIECRIDTKDGDDDEWSKRRHVPIAFGFLLVPHGGMKARPLDIPYKQFVGDQCVEQGMHEIERVARQVADWVSVYGDQKVSLSPEQKREHAASERCFVCDKCFGASGPLSFKVCEHDHLTGEYRGAACQACNNKMRMRRLYLPVYFHNFKNYDAHAICIESLGKMKNWELSVIPNTKEKYMSVYAKFVLDENAERKRYMNVVFRDTYQFLTASLDSLVGNLDVCDLVYASRVVPNPTMAASKGVFPYSYLDSVDRLSETALPGREAFFDDLSRCECPVEKYERAQEAWRVIGCRTFEDYLLFYLRLDVHQLADVFERFRELCMCEDGLEPSYYVTLPGMVWDSAFKMTGCSVDLLTDADMYEFFERGIRGGMTFVNTHFTRTNSERVPEVYDSSQPHSDILYIDANNLYGHALSQRLPQSEFKWMSESDWSSVDIATYDYENGDFAHVFEVDLSYPGEIHDETRDLPFCPEKETVCETMFSEVMCEQWRGMSRRTYKGCEKLLLTQWDKERYVVHGRVLQFYLRKGMLVTKIHRAISFRQTAFLEPYIRYNSERRQQAANSFEKDYYKLRNNAIFGKTLESVRRRLSFTLCNDADKLVRLASKPSYLNRYIFTEDLVGIHLARERVYLNKPVFIGQAVLDLSKLEMYELRYDVLPRYASVFEGGEIRVLGGDTDSFFLHLSNVPADSLLRMMSTDDVLDSSNYPRDHVLYSERNKAKLGRVKDESGGRVFAEICMLRPKAYSFLYANSNGCAGIKRAKGVQRAVLKNEITHADYVRAWRENLVLSHTQRRIGSSMHQLYTFQYSKKTLSFFDDKRYWTNANESLPYGHYSIGQTRPHPSKVYYPPSRLD